MGESQILSTHIATSVIRNMLWPSATQIDGIDVPGPADQLASKATVPDRYHVHLFSGLLVAETPSVDIAMKWLKSGLAAGMNFTDFIKSKEKYAMAPGGEYDTDMSMIWNFRIHIIFWPALRRPSEGDGGVYTRRMGLGLALPINTSPVPLWMVPEWDSTIHGKP
ncbi:hypothetical protein B0H12DRAFT_1067267 [Mycena haematopus]|nr:hypothetical protein B0H12DRAFT_1067267 [Mycena haematopus]